MRGIVLQARMSSTRLPGKVALPLGGASLIEQAMARLKLVKVDIRVLATDAASAPDLSRAAERMGFEILVGPTQDVLARYCLAIRRFGIDDLLRATADNPLVSHELANLLLKRIESAPVDYAGYMGMPLGMGVEYARSEALLRAESEAREEAEREHVCPYLYGHPELFRIDRPEAPPDYLLSDASVTVDTIEDYESVLKIYGALYDGHPIPSLSVIALLREPRRPVTGTKGAS